jgi:hypothetical protein
VTLRCATFLRASLAQRNTQEGSNKWYRQVAQGISVAFGYKCEGSLAIALHLRAKGHKCFEKEIRVQRVLKRP